MLIISRSTGGIHYTLVAGALVAVSVW